MNERPLWLALAVCILVRIVLEVRYGLGFDVDVKLWQLVDVELLRDDPLRSLFLMHAQPPLFNALYALSLRLPEGLGVPFLHLVFQATSIVSVALIYLLLRRARVGPVGAAIAAGLFGILPQTLIFESVFNYAPFEVMFLLGGMLLAARYLEEGGVARFAGLCACLVILAFMRSLFHIGWIAVALLAVWSLRSWRHGRDSRALAVLVVSLALVSSIYFKNLKLYGAFAASTWEGIALTQLAAPILPGDPVKFPQVLSDIRQRIDRGEFSPALKGAITINKGRVEQGNFNSYDVMRINETPKIDVHIVETDNNPGGIGEASGPVIAPAVANAIFAATGKRLRKMPMKPEDIA